MNTSILSLEVPKLFLRKGHRLLQVTPEQASRLMDAKRENEAMRTGRGFSVVRDIPLHDIDGNRIGMVSYNGRVWLETPDGDREIPLPGVKTAAQQESEGWKDCL